MTKSEINQYLPHVGQAVNFFQGSLYLRGSKIYDTLRLVNRMTLMNCMVRRSRICRRRKYLEVTVHTNLKQKEIYIVLKENHLRLSPYLALVVIEESNENVIL